MTEQLTLLMTRIADALERIAPLHAPPSLGPGAAFVWDGARQSLTAVEVRSVPLAVLVGIDSQKKLLLDNSLRFAQGMPANSALLWGARGMGKSSLVKAVHAAIRAAGHDLALIEIHREDIATLPFLMDIVGRSARRTLIYCDDLAFEAADASFKALKSALEGGLVSRPSNILFYATSNRRHLVARDMIDNEQATGNNPRDALDDKLALADRFGLWIGFHACSQDTYFAMVQNYVQAFDLPVQWAEIEAEAIEWQATRGARSGRVAWQYVLDLAGRLGKVL